MMLKIGSTLAVTIACQNGMGTDRMAFTLAAVKGEVARTAGEPLRE